MSTVPLDQPSKLTIFESPFDGPVMYAASIWVAVRIPPLHKATADQQRHEVEPLPRLSCIALRQQAERISASSIDFALGDVLVLCW